LIRKKKRMLLIAKPRYACMVNLHGCSKKPHRSGADM
jgi:hypothetical protein